MQDTTVYKRLEKLITIIYYPTLLIDSNRRARFFDKYFFYRDEGKKISEARKRAAYHALVK